jgi:hypothetical protein
MMVPLRVRRHWNVALPSPVKDQLGLRFCDGLGGADVIEGAEGAVRSSTYPELEVADDRLLKPSLART